MYSSINTISPFPQLTSTIHLSSPNFFPHERDTIFLHDPLSGLFFPSYDSAAASNKPPSPQQPPRKKKTNIPKKDRHSKIFTAHGPRDRRVRLSMEIARKFFDLQDLLGFDKASKTLDWLLTNSKAAIKELVQMKISCTTGSQCDMVCENYNESLPVGNEKIRDAFDISSRESRAKARARARDRTREKMRVRELEESIPIRIDGHDLSPNSRSWAVQMETCCNPAEDWDISTANIIPEFQHHAKPWDVYNNHTIPD